MNKYQEALDRFEETFRHVTSDDDLTNEKRDTLQELVDRAKPMKPTNQYPIDFGLGNYGDCRICNYGVNYQQNYCDNCGRKLDWSEDE